MISRAKRIWRAMFGAGYDATNARRRFISQQMASRKSMANDLLNGELAGLREHCRQLERNNPTARGAVEGLAAIIVGSGIGLEPDTGDTELDQKISEHFKEWLKNCGINGESMSDLQRLAMKEIVVAGEAIIRIIPSKDDVPFALLPLDAEWIADDVLDDDNINGIKVDKYGRPVSYYLANPSAIMTKAEVVPAKDIIHVFERRRPVQNRGEPWMTPVIETLAQERELVDTELYAARQTAAVAIAITSDDHEELDTSDYGTTDDPAQQIAMGSVVRLFGGDKMQTAENKRPSQQISPFRQMLRGDIAAAMRISQRFLDRDASRANYSSMRADMLDQERLTAQTRIWLGHATIGRAYELALPVIAARLGIKTPNIKSYKLLPDGQPYVDPQKDVAAALAAIAGGMSTYEAEIGKRGGDWRKIMSQRAAEDEFIEEKGVNIAPNVPETGGDDEE